MMMMVLYGFDMLYQCIGDRPRYWKRYSPATSASSLVGRSGQNLPDPRPLRAWQHVNSIKA